MSSLDKLMVNVYVRMIHDGTTTLEEVRKKVKAEVYEAVVAALESQARTS